MGPTLWKSAEPILLASTSTTRLKVLRRAGLPVETLRPSVDERVVEAKMQEHRSSPEQIALGLAKAKGLDVSSRCPDRWVVAADQTLALHGQQYHKPASAQEARCQLRSLAGQTHYLHSAVVCYFQEQLRFELVDTARMQMRTLSETFLDAYLDSAGDAVTTSVGGYQIEGAGAQLFTAISGDYTTIMGLPLLPLLEFFRGANLLER